METVKVYVDGMHCASCEVLIERKLKKVAGVESVSINHATGRGRLTCSQVPSLDALNDAIKADGYHIRADGAPQPEVLATSFRPSQRHYLELGGIFVIIVAVLFALQRLDLIPALGFSETMSYGLIFGIGMVAAVSTCMAVTGGLLVAVAAKYNELHTKVSGFQKFKPHLYFNAGRIVSYTVFGALIGYLGSMFTFSPRVTGIITIVASAVMVILGMQLIHLFPGLKRLQPRMPKALAHFVHDRLGTENPLAPFLFGSSTFFMPCGFTQALQLYVLSRGSAVEGALTMLVFALGTLPALLSLSAISSFAKGAFQNYFVKFAGVLVIIIGFFNINNGLVLAGSPVTPLSFLEDAVSSVGSTKAAGSDAVPITNGKQIVNMKVVGYNYVPSRFTITAGVPVEWNVDGSAASGCARVIVAPSMNITEYLPLQGAKTIRFTPQAAGDIRFSCSMGMTTPGAGFTVLAAGTTRDTILAPAPSAVPTTIAPTCNKNIAQCEQAQEATITISQESGFVPKSVTVRKGLPVKLTLDAKVQLRGCMSVMMIPEYNVVKRMELGPNEFEFTPTQTGTVPITCSMGSRMAFITVTD